MTELTDRASAPLGGLNHGPTPADGVDGPDEEEDADVLMVFVFALGVLTVPLAGGRLRAVADVDLRRAPALFAALALQVLVISILPDLPRPLLDGLHLASYALAAWFLVANRRVVGLWVVAVGAGANLLAIAANGGVMPASRGALERAGLAVTSGQFENSAVVSHARLAPLGDVFAVPRWLPFANVFSVGDVLVVLGALLVLHQVCGSRLTRSSAERTGSDGDLSGGPGLRRRAAPGR